MHQTPAREKGEQRSSRKQRDARIATGLGKQSKETLFDHNRSRWRPPAFDTTLLGFGGGGILEEWEELIEDRTDQMGEDGGPAELMISGVGRLCFLLTEGKKISVYRI